MEWLKGPRRKTHAEKLAFARLRAGTQRTAQAWELKEAAADLWNYRSRTWALAGWHRWLEWASGCGLEPVLKAARMIREHLWGIVNAIILRATNGPAEGINSRINTVKGPQPRLSATGNASRTPSSSTSAASTSTPMAYAHDLLPTRKGEEPSGTPRI